MNLAEALATVELVELNWPRTTLADETKQLWAQAIVEREPHSAMSDGYDAIRDLATHQTFPPALVEVLLGIRGARLSRIGREARPGLPEPRTARSMSFARFLHDHPDMGARVRTIATDGKYDCITEALAGFLRGTSP